MNNRAGHGLNRFEILAFLLGCMASLFVNTPVGFVAMLDMVGFVFGLPLILMQIRHYPKRLKTCFLFAVLWCLNAIVTDFWRGTPRLVAVKEAVLIVDYMCLMAVGVWILGKTPQAILFFVAGTSVSSVISLYYFQNGALLSYALERGYESGDMGEFLQEKQVFPLYLNMFFLCGVMMARMLFRLPWFFCVLLTFGSSIFLLLKGGSRSSFAIYACAGLLMMMYVWGRRMMNYVFRHKIVMSICVVVAAIVLNALLMLAMKNGLLGEGGLQKYEARVAKEGTFLDNRADLLINFPFLVRSPLIGAGSLMIDRWGIVNRSPYVSHFDKQGRYKERLRFFGHSHIFHAWTGNGLFGLLFWAYVLWLFADFMGRKSAALGDGSPFVMYVMITAMFAILFSPYGGRGRVAFLAAFAALASDIRFQDWLRSAGNYKWWVRKRFGGRRI